MFFSCRRFGTKCGGCSLGISPNDLVRRARNKVFHLKCFTCVMCRKQLSTGEELYVIDENRFICKEDYLASRHGSTGEFCCTPEYIWGWTTIYYSSSAYPFSNHPNVGYNLLLYWCCLCWKYTLLYIIATQFQIMASSFVHRLNKLTNKQINTTVASLLSPSFMLTIDNFG